MMAKSVVIAIIGLAMILTSLKLWSSPSFHANRWQEQMHRHLGPQTPERTKLAMRGVLACVVLAGAILMYVGVAQLAH